MILYSCFPALRPKKQAFFSYLTRYQALILIGTFLALVLAVCANSDASLNRKGVNGRLGHEFENMQ